MAGVPSVERFPVLGVEIVAHGIGQRGWSEFTAAELRESNAAVRFTAGSDHGKAVAHYCKFFAFGNADLEVADVRLEPAVVPTSAADAPRSWDLLSRLAPLPSARRLPDGNVVAARRRHPGGFLVGPAAFLLPEGGYRLTVRGDAGKPLHSGYPVLAVDISARAERGCRDFTAEELQEGAVFDFDVPPRLSDRQGGSAAFVFHFSDLGNADLTVTSVMLTERPAPLAAAPLPTRLRLSARFRAAAGKLDRSGALLTAGGVLRRPQNLHDIRPRLRLAAGRYELAFEAATAALRAKAGLDAEICVQTHWQPPGLAGTLVRKLKWRVPHTIARLASR
ncbi:MAG TPA: hypothetical protein VGD36_12665, partial [Xanthobacteraceae bacterium]